MKQHRQSTAGPAPTQTGGSPMSADSSNQAALERMAELAEQEPDHPVLDAIGEGIGMGAGVLVTELLALLPSWREPVVDETGEPVQQVPGAERVGDNDIEKRHTQVVVPKIEAYAEGLDEGWWRDLVAGVGEGASDAPGASYRLEASVMDLFDGD